MSEGQKWVAIESRPRQDDRGAGEAGEEEGLQILKVN
jgi:hypothetical protein